MSPRLDRRAAVAIGLMALLAILPLVATWLDQGFYVGQLRRVLIFAIAAVSLDIILGYGGMVSLGHAAFVGAGAYVVALLHWHADRGIEILGLLPGTMQSLASPALPTPSTASSCWPPASRSPPGCGGSSRARGSAC